MCIHLYTHTLILNITYIKVFEEAMFYVSIYFKTFWLITLSILMSTTLEFSHSFKTVIISETLDPFPYVIVLVHNRLSVNTSSKKKRNFPHTET